MPDETPTAPSAPTPAPLGAAPDASTLIDPLALLGACADPVRFGILRELTKADSLSVNDLAARLKRAPDAISKHLRVLRDARVLLVVAAPDGDGRKQHHQVPAPFRIRDAAGRPALDFGTVVLRFSI